ncbi:MAG: class I SAM-dependent methyltransferase [Polyangiales bacterium]
MSPLQARAAIQRGGLRGEALREVIRAAPWRDRERFVDQMLGLPPIPPDAPLPSGAVPYLPSPVDTVLAAAREAPITSRDVFVDVGSGLGRVAMLVHLLTGAVAKGVELQPALVALARARCAELGLKGVSFTQGDATTVAPEALEGSVFYLYAPFNGPMKRRALARLQAIAQTRRVRLCAIDFELSEEAWLRERPSTDLSLTLYVSR